ncbi:MAG: FtsX-like permease family protein [Actinomycetota bacterium]
MAEWRALARLARRSIRRAPGRSALVVGVIAVTVGAGVVAAGLARSYVLVDEQRVVARLGTADVSTDDWPGPREAPAEPQVTGPGVTTFGRIGLGGGDDYTEISSVDLDDALSRGMFRLVSGRLPNPGEVALTSQVLADLDLGIGDSYSLPISLDELLIVGELRHPVDRSQRTVVVDPVDLPGPAQWTTYLFTWDAFLRSSLADPATTDGDLVFREGPAGVEIAGSYVDRSALTFDDTDGGIDLSEPAQLSTAISGALLLEAAVVAAAAFTVGTRRRVKEFGQLGVAGASDAHLRALVLLESFLLSAIGVLVGIALGALTLIVGAPWWSRLFDRWDDGVDLGAGDLVGPAFVGIAAAMLAAWLPARTVGRLAPAQALAGRLPPARYSSRLAVTGVILIGAGLLGFGAVLSANQTSDALAAMLVGSLVAVFIGTALSAGPLIAVAGRLGGKASGLARLVVRDSARQSVRSGASVAALLVVVALPVIVATAVASDPFFEQERAHLDEHFVRIDAVEPPAEWGWDRDGLRELQLVERSATALSEVADVEAQAELRRGFASVRLRNEEWVTWSSYDRRVVGVADDDVIDVLEFGDDVRAALERGEWVAGYGQYDGPYDQMEVVGDVRADQIVVGASVPEGRNGWQLPSWWVSPETAERIGLDDIDVGSIHRLGAPLLARDEARIESLVLDSLAVDGLIESWPTPDEEAVRRQLATDMFGVNDLDQLTVALREQLDEQVEFVMLRSVWVTPQAIVARGIESGQGRSGLYPQEVAGVILAASLGVAVLIALIGAALSAVEIDRELGTMVAMGASPSIRRRFIGLQSGYHTAIAALLGTPIAVALVAVAYGSDDFDQGSIVVPWPTIVVVIAVMPVFVGVTMALVFRSGRPTVSRRLS